MIPTFQVEFVLAVEVVEGVPTKELLLLFDLLRLVIQAYRRLQRRHLVVKEQAIHLVALEPLEKAIKTPKLLNYSIPLKTLQLKLDFEAALSRGI